MPISIYGRHTSYNVQKVLWLLDDLGIKYNHIELGSNPGDTETDEFGNSVAKDPLTIHDIHATILHQLGLDHERLTYRFGGRDVSLTDVHGRVLGELLV